MNVGGEANAVELDKLIATEVLPELRQMPGFVKAVRNVCKADWDYEVAYVFDSHDNFKNFMSSNFFKKYSVLQDRAVQGFSVDPDAFYEGNRVRDEWN
jgi:hypothetical protein